MSVQVRLRHVRTG